ncbi:hypothetical protein WN48_03562 [Eufriesea mexicana]|nr:hypothetical protein WN48_03562 [Eufriesea mexicana]
MNVAQRGLSLGVILYERVRLEWHARKYRSACHEQRERTEIPLTRHYAQKLWNNTPGPLALS